MATINDRRRAADLPLSNFSLALHLGDVMYGNIGAEDRLDFTVVGPAVNMAARIQDLCRPLERDVIISAAMAKSAVRERQRIVSMGRYVLRGVPEPQELFTLYQGALIRTHRDRVGGPSGRRGGAGDAGHRHAVPTPSDGPHPRPEGRLPKAFGRRRARLAMSHIATPHAPCRKPWETVSMGPY